MNWCGTLPEPVEADAQELKIYADGDVVLVHATEPLQKARFYEDPELVAGETCVAQAVWGFSIRDATVRSEGQNQCMFYNHPWGRCAHTCDSLELLSLVFVPDSAPPSNSFP